MTEMRKNIIDILPDRMRGRPVDHRGYPVPWFVTVKDDQGQWDFRPVDSERVVQAIRKEVCWICGQRLGGPKAFAVGPMCGVNRISGEPPQHPECAEFAVRACPFMLLPMAKRRTANLPEGTTENPGAIKRNPGVTLIWHTKKFTIIPNGPSFLWQMGEPTDISFWTEGRTATRREIDESVAGGLPTLTGLAEAQSTEAVSALNRMVEAFTMLLPEPAT